METQIPPSRKLLIANFYYPPTARFGGAVRWYSFVKYLPQYGWNPLLLCCQEKNENPLSSRVIKIKPYTRLNKPFRLIQWGWMPPLYRQVCRLVSRQDYRILIMSGPPMWYLNMIFPLKRRFPRLKVVLDLRDPWYANPQAKEKITPLEKALKALVGGYLEREMLRRADLVTVVTPGMKRLYAERYPFLKQRLMLLPNGFDIPPLKSKPGGGPDRDFTLVYAGSFDSNQDPTCIFRAMLELKHEPVRICFIGNIHEKWRALALNMGLEKRVEFTGPVPHVQALGRMSQAQALLLLLQPTKGPSHVVSGKVYEYIHLGKPIVVISTPGDSWELVRRHSRHSILVGDYHPRSIAAAIKKLYGKWKSGVDLSYRNIGGFDQLYHRRALTARLARMLEAL